MPDTAFQFAVKPVVVMTEAALATGASGNVVIVASLE